MLLDLRQLWNRKAIAVVATVTMAPAAYVGTTEYAPLEGLSGLGAVGVLQEGGFTKVPTDPITDVAVDIPDFVGATATLGMTTFKRNGVDACPYFALTHDPRTPGWYQQGNAYLTFTFSVHARPMQFVSADEVHYLFSLHEAVSLGREILSVGVTPSGRLVVSVAGHPDITTATGAIVFDGRAYRVDLEHATRPDQIAETGPVGPDRTLLSVNGVAVVRVTRYPSYGLPADSGGPKRFMFFNGIAGGSRVSATIYQCEFAYESFPAVSGLHRAIRWEFGEGQGATVLGREVRPGQALPENVVDINGNNFGDEIVWDVTAQRYDPGLFGYPPTWQDEPGAPSGCYRRMIRPWYVSRGPTAMGPSSAGPAATTYTPNSPTPITTQPGQPEPIT